jgi:hypothetical protein
VRSATVALVNSFKRVVSPALVLLYAALEGLFVGAFSRKHPLTDHPDDCPSRWPEAE